jgi:hypothetical protein
MELTADSTKVEIPHNPFFSGEPVKVIRRGRNRVRVKRPDGNQILVEVGQLTPTPGGDSNHHDSVEKLARIVESLSFSTGRKFVRITLTPNGVVLQDRRNNFFGEPLYPEIKEKAKAEELKNRLERYKILKKVILTIP